MKLLECCVELEKVKRASGSILRGFINFKFGGRLDERSVLKHRSSVSNKVTRLASNSVNWPVLVHVAGLLEETLLVGGIRSECFSCHKSVAFILNVVVVIRV